MSQVHYLKCWPGPFQSVVGGRKRFELRRNDRDYGVGDTLVLQEWDPEEEEDYTGREYRVKVTHMMSQSWDDPPEEDPVLQLGLDSGWVVLSTRPVEPKTGVELIAAERERQISEEGWTPEHDAEHDEGELAWAAVHFAAPDIVKRRQGEPEGSLDVFPESWDEKWDKKGRDGRIQDLVRAGALAAAEIDRLLAAAVEIVESFPAGNADR